MPIPKGPNCFGDVMKEFKAGALHSGKGGPVVKSSKQAKAIASSMCMAEDFTDGVKKVVYGEAMAPLGYPHPNVPAKFLQGSSSKQKANGHKLPRPEDNSVYYRDPYQQQASGLGKRPNLGSGLGLQFTDGDDYEGNSPEPGNNKMAFLQGLYKEMKCWKGYRKAGTQISKKTGKRVNKCVKVDHAEEVVNGVDFLVTRAKQIREEEQFSENEQADMVMTRLRVMDGRILQMMSAIGHAMEMGEVEMHPWMIDKITLAADYLSAVADNVAYGDGLEIEIEDEYAEGKGWKGAYKKGLSKDEEASAKRASKRAMDAPKKSDKSLEMWPSDKKVNKRRKESGKEAPKSPATKAYHNMFDSKEKKSGTTAGLKKKSEDSGIPLGILRQVYAKGVAAWKSGHRPGMTPQQWAYARVNSFITGSGGARKADADLWKKASAAKKKSKKS